MILLLDNYDSFVYNLDRYLQNLGQRTLVVRSDAINVESIERLDCKGIVISPGPKTPDDAGCSLEVVRRLAGRIPILGVCLGHQTIGQAMGARIVRAPAPVHGQSSPVYHANSKLMAGLPSPFDAGRYHSLVVDETSLPDCLVTTAWTKDGLIMGFEHQEYPLLGVQFHPESILTNVGYTILRNFLISSGIANPPQIPSNDFNATRKLADNADR
ncbi:MAG: aminodeoxychorismate/anthranilate synthase component II [Pirellulaceae bacterium]|nr:aminodeoxychorismate/anthranilate synthase component II [Pirellulaceae bacterium]